MVAAVRQTVTVGSGGRIEITAPELREGDRAEVIVLVEDRASAERRLAALDKLQKSLNLDDEKVRQWLQVVREQREAFGPQE